MTLYRFAIFAVAIILIMIRLQLFGDALLIANTMGELKLGTISLDGTKIKANASKHKALSWEHANKLEQQMKDEIEMLMKMAEEAEARGEKKALNISEELKRREDRLAKITQAKAEIEARAKARHEEEQKDYDKKMKARQEIENETGKKAMGFHQFLLRGVANVSGEWNLVCTAFNIRRLHRCSVAS